MKAEWLLIDDEDIRIEKFCRLKDQRFAHCKRILDINMLVDGGVFTAIELDNAWNFHKIHTGFEVEGTRDLRT